MGGHGQIGGFTIPHQRHRGSAGGAGAACTVSDGYERQVQRRKRLHLVQRNDACHSDLGRENSKDTDGQDM
jgi:hypothetical protein